MATLNISDKPTLPPKPTPKPGEVKIVRALYSYKAQHSNELSFEEGELLYVYDRDRDSNWWKAKCGNQEGFVPVNYVTEQTEEVELPLHEAARRGNLSFLRECLKRGVSRTGLDSAGNTPLYWAARTGHIDCVKELLNVSSPAVNAQNRMGESPLHTAAYHGHLEVVNLLLEAGADITLRNKKSELAEDLAFNPLVKNAIQMSRKQYIPNHSYGVEDYNDESD
ncbi:osteoclast-stimulating factor 1-like [Orussus abietinus]|uniref:osteoclast-stimulating factor 1-like n=1 Tax=Orussus abietinus TaxID=222816 RepID=UPI000626AB14|nr:osteoclast-stimulating factor 1-like [Orussus abietinus]